MNTRIATAIPGVTARDAARAASIGKAQVYRLSERIAFYDNNGHKRWTTLVWVSTSNAMGGVETYAFPCTLKGKVRSWRELSGSERGTSDHAKVLGNVGFTLQTPEDLAKSEARKALSDEHGQTWDTTELQRDFTVLGFAACMCVVERKSDGKRGSLDFTHSPRFYFGFQEG